MAKKTSNKELKPKKEVKEVIAKEVSKPFPKDAMIKLYLFRDEKEYVVTNAVAKKIIESKKGKLV